MLAFCRSSLKSKKYFIILLALAAIAGLGTHAAWSSNGLPRIDNKTLARLAQQHPVVVLFRHAERCDRSTNQCLSGNDSNLLIVFYVQIMPDDFVMQLHRF